ncbi:hypothetical protein DBV05_g1725 [Lasiodiplodia theobromae]|uniref:Kelch repeat-containing protein n=1 Tax=Lasiodiplodia theobromae TaxID=45133 RepID=A0A5N5DQV7_9PEZI|nr:hypothetical protein DBV05_g1725 [Lasiodiplodia theobromae]
MAARGDEPQWSFMTAQQGEQGPSIVKGAMVAGTGRAFDDVYVLSLPSFRWIRISDFNNPDKALQPSPGRNRHKCDMWRDAQMTAMGGLATLGQWTSQHLNDVCNETYPPVRVLDTSTYTWRTQFEPGLEYSVPDAVTTVIGGNSTGGAVLSSPAAGWGFDELSNIFLKRVQRDTDDGTSTGSAQTSATNTGGSNASSDDSRGGLFGGAVAGIVIGSIAAFVAIVVTILWWRRWRRARLTKKLAAEREVVDGGWQKPELEAREQRRQELDMRTQVHETHGDAVAIRPVELPVHTRPSEMPG